MAARALFPAFSQMQMGMCARLWRKRGNGYLARLFASQKACSSSADHFELLAIPRHFDIDLKALEMSYKKLQQKHHPDQYATKTKDSSTDDGTEEYVIEDPVLLMEVMDLQELIDSTEDQDKLKRIYHDVESSYRSFVGSVSAAFEEECPSGVQKSIHCLSYYDKLRKSVLAKMDAQ
eukprot:jgi/Bigna1/83963/fgenesh1_pg.119_\